ncbi:MAG TPA: hypothetical protein P5162_08765 [Bacteroidia bacterium]|nr:hypothetical protein [Bacteroidia bacterium]
MYNNKTDIFQTSQCLSKEKLIAYSKGTLTAAEEHEVEKHLTDCELCSDALEGLAMPDTSHALDETIQTVAAKYSTGHGHAPAASRWWYAAASVVLLLAAGWVISVYNHTGEEKIAAKLTPAEHPVTPPPPPPAEIKATPIEPNSDRSVAESQHQISEEHAAAIPNKKSEKASGITAQPMQSPPADTISSGVGLNDAYAVAATVAEPEPVQDHSYREKSVMAAGAPVAENNSRLKKIQGFKTYNYANEYTYRADVPAMSNEESVDSDIHKNKDKSRALNTMQVKNVSYDELLESALSELNRKKYEIALQKFQLILSEHADDVNALYYGAWCCNEMKQYSNALVYLNKLDASSNKTFQQESVKLRAAINKNSK